MANIYHMANIYPSLLSERPIVAPKYYNIMKMIIWATSLYSYLQVVGIYIRLAEGGHIWQSPIPLQQKISLFSIPLDYKDLLCL
jgi:hypothetical protein